MPDVVPNPDATGQQNRDPIAPERNVAPSAGGTVPNPANPTPEVTFTPEQQAAIASLIADRLERARTAAAREVEQERATTRTLEERLAEVERTAREQVERSERAAVQAIVERAAANTHNPELVVRAVDLDGLTSSDAAEIGNRVATFLNANPYLMRSNAGPSAPAPTPGATSTGDAGAKLLTPEQMRALTATDLQDEDTMRLYLDSMAVHGPQPV